MDEGRKTYNKVIKIDKIKDESESVYEKTVCIEGKVRRMKYIQK